MNLKDKTNQLWEQSIKMVGLQIGVEEELTKYFEEIRDILIQEAKKELIDDYESEWKKGNPLSPNKMRKRHLSTHSSGNQILYSEEELKILQDDTFIRMDKEMLNKFKEFCKATADNSDFKTATPKC